MQHGDPTKKLDELSELLRQFRSVRRDFLSKVTAFRVSIPHSAQSTGSKSHSGTPLLAAKRIADEDRLNSWFTDGWSDALNAASTASEVFLQSLAEENAVRGKLDALIKNSYESIKREIVEDYDKYARLVLSSEHRILLESQKIQHLTESIFPKLNILNEDLQILSDTIKTQIVLFNERVLVLDKKFQDNEALIKLLRGMPRLADLRLVDSHIGTYADEKIYQDIESMIANQLGTEWRVDWNKEAPHAAAVKAFKEKWKSLEPRLIERGKALRAQEAACGTINWPEKLGTYRTLPEEIKNLLSRHRFDLQAFNEKLNSLLAPLQRETPILTLENKQQQIELIESAFNTMLADVSAQTNAAAEQLSRIDSFIEGLPPTPNSEMLNLDKQDISDLQALYAEYSNQIKFLTVDIGIYATHLSNEHIMIMLNMLRCIVTPEVYKELCMQAGVTRDLSIEGLFEEIKSPENNQSLKHSIHHIILSISHRIAKPTFKVLSFIKKLEKIRAWVDGENVPLDWYKKFCELGGGEDARKILAVAEKFLEKTRESFAKEVEKIEENKREVNNLLVEMGRNNGIKSAFTLLNDEIMPHFHHAAQVMQQNHEQMTNELQEEVETQREQLKSKWHTHDTGGNRLEDAVWGKYKPVVALNMLRRNLLAVKEKFKWLHDEDAQPNIPVGSTAPYKEIITQFNILMTLIQKIHATSEAMLNEEALVLRTYMSNHEVIVKSKVDASRLLLNQSIIQHGELNDKSADAFKQSSAELKKLKNDLKPFAGLLSALKQNTTAVKDSSMKRKKLDESAEVLSQRPTIMLGVIPFRLEQVVQEEWLNRAVRRFLSHYEEFARIQKTSQQYVCEAANWAETLRENHSFLQAAHQRWFDVFNLSAEAKQVVKAHKRNAEESRAILRKARLPLEAMIVSNNRIKQLIQHLKEEVQGHLSALVQDNPYIHSMVMMQLDKLVKLDAKVWRELAEMKQKSEQLSVANEQVYENYHLELSAQLERFRRMSGKYEIGEVVAKSYLLAHGITEHLNQNPFYRAILVAESFKVFEGKCKEFQGNYKKKVDDKIKAIKDRFYLFMQSNLAQVKEICKKVEAKEKRFQESTRIAEGKFTEFSSAMRALGEASNQVKSEIILEPTCAPFSELGFLPGILDTNLQRVVTQVNERGALAIKDTHIPDLSIKEFSLVELKRDLAVAIITLEQNSLIAFNARWEELNAKKEKIESLRAEKIRLITQRDSCGNKVQLLNAEKARLEAAQENNKQMLLDLMRLLLSETAYAAVHEEANQGSNSTLLLALMAARLKKKQAELVGIKEKASKLKGFLPALKTLQENGYTTPLTELSGMMLEALKVLRAKVYPLRTEWNGLMHEYTEEQATKAIEAAHPAASFEKKHVQLKFEFLELDNIKNFSDHIKFHSSLEEDEKKLRGLIKEIVEVLDSIERDKSNILLEFVSVFSQPMVEHWAQGKAKLWNFYQLEMDKVLAIFKWLIDVHARLVAFKTMDEAKDVVSLDDIKKFTDWDAQWAQPFLDKYGALLKRAEKIEDLDRAIKKLAEEQAMCESKLLVFATLEEHSKKVSAQINLFAPLKAKITRRIEEINEFSSEERKFNNELVGFTEESVYANVNSVIFHRFKHLFLHDSEKNDIIEKLRARAKIHQNTDKVKESAINEFISLIESDNNKSLLDLFECIRQPLTIKKLGESKLERSAGGPTKTCELIQCLFDVMQRMVKRHGEILFLDDLKEKIDGRRAQLLDVGFLDEVKPYDGVPCLVNPLFIFHLNRIKEELNGSPTKRKDAKSGIIAKLAQESEFNSQGNELNKLIKLKEILSIEFLEISKSAKGSPGKFFGEGSRLGAQLKIQLERLEQVLAGYPKEALRLTEKPV